MAGPNGADNPYRAHEATIERSVDDLLAGKFPAEHVKQELNDLFRKTALDAEDRGKVQRIAKQDEKRIRAQAQPEPEPIVWTIESKCLLDVEARPVAWHWEPRIAGRMVSVLGGAKGTGKGWIAADLLAKTTTGGYLPVEGLDSQVPIPKGRVLYLNSEDPEHETIRPRFDAAGADHSEVELISTITRSDRPTERLVLSLNDHWKYLVEQYLANGDGFDVFMVDTLTSNAGADLNSNSEMAPIMARLADAAQTYNMAVVLVTHTVKVPHSRASSDIAGASVITTTSRSVLYAGTEFGKGRRALYHLDSNCGVEAPAIGFKVAPMKWTGATELTLEECRNHRQKRDGLSRDALAAQMHEALKDGPAKNSGIGQTDSQRQVSRTSLGNVGTGRIGNSGYTFYESDREKFLAMKAEHDDRKKPCAHRNNEPPEGEEPWEH